jgi:hypothetical protein
MSLTFVRSFEVRLIAVGLLSRVAGILFESMHDGTSKSTAEMLATSLWSPLLVLASRSNDSSSILVETPPQLVLEIIKSTMSATGISME